MVGNYSLYYPPSRYEFKSACEPPTWNWKTLIFLSRYENEKFAIICCFTHHSSLERVKLFLLLSFFGRTELEEKLSREREKWCMVLKAPYEMK